MNYLCEPLPVDNFRYHLDCNISDQAMIKITEGPRWADPSDSDDVNMIWCDLNIDGTPVLPSGTSSNTCLEWVDFAT